MNTEKQIVVIYHRADFDGIFCREIARKFLGKTAEYIGWDFGDKTLSILKEQMLQADVIYVMDLPIDRVFGLETAHAGGIGCGGGNYLNLERFIWIDHHKSSIETHPTDIPGYRIDGVAACRLAWQWFMKQWRASTGMIWLLPDMPEFVERRVSEPEAVRLAGEYDIWDKRDPRADILQLGLCAKELTEEDWKWLLTPHEAAHGEYELGMVNVTLSKRLQDGKLLQAYVDQRDAAIVGALGFVVEFEGLKFLALNSATKGSLQFAAKDVPATGHDALLKFNYTGAQWDVSLYHAKHRTDLDLSGIAKKHGGGGHRGACGFRLKTLPFLTGGNRDNGVSDSVTSVASC